MTGVTRVAAGGCDGRRRWSRRGAVAAEFAVVSGVLLVVLLALVDLGFAFHEQLVLTQAVREGARRAAIAGGAGPEVSEAVDAIFRAAGLDSERLEFEVRPRSAVYGTTIVVTARYRHRLRSPVLRGLAGRPELELSAKAVTRSEMLRR